MISFVAECIDQPMAFPSRAQFSDAVLSGCPFYVNLRALRKVEANRLAIQRHHEAHGGAMRFGDLPESLLQLCKFRLSLLPIFLSLL